MLVPQFETCSLFIHSHKHPAALELLFYLWHTLYNNFSSILNQYQYLFTLAKLELLR